MKRAFEAQAQAAPLLGAPESFGLTLANAANPEDGWKPTNRTGMRARGPTRPLPDNGRSPLANSSPEQTIRRLLDQHPSHTNATVGHLLKTFGVEEDDADGRGQITTALFRAGVGINRALPFLGADEGLDTQLRLKTFGVEEGDADDRRRITNARFGNSVGIDRSLPFRGGEEGLDIRLREPTSALRSTNPTVSIVIPALNEADNITPLIQGLPGCVNEIIVVDGRSGDETVQVALDADPRVRVVLERRQGKGVAMLSGFASATSDVIVAIDADGSMDPGEVAMLQATLALGFDLVKGSRAVVGGGSNDFSAIRRFGNGALTRLANTLYGTHWSDMCYGYFGFWRDVLPALVLPWTPLTSRALAHELEPEGAGGPGAYGNGFEIEAMLFLRGARANLRIAEVPSWELPRASGASHLRTLRDGTRVLAAIAHERMRRAPVQARPAGTAAGAALVGNHG